MKCTTAIVVIALGASVSAGAQTRPAPRPARPPSDRIFISVNGAYQVASKDFGDSVTFVENAENGRFSTQYDVTSGPAFNVSAAAAVWRNLGVGVGVSRFSHSTPTALTATVPHPFFFNRARDVSGTVSGLTREELAVHVQARAMVPMRNRFQVMVFGGPSFFQVKQDIVNDLEITDAYPYDVATFSRAVSNTSSESKVGFNVGADVGYFFTRQLGVGFTLQYAGTTLEVPSPGGGTIDVKAGGVQAGGGLRLRF